MILIYRAQIFSYQPAPAQPYQKPRALNWRFHAPGQSYGDDTCPVAAYTAPRALNWRFQMAAGMAL
jgi:hypothetical protein